MKKTYFAFALLVLCGVGILAADRFFKFSNFHPNQMAETASAADEPKHFWTCGMHPQVVQDHPGDCPICHMKLTPMNLSAGSDDHKGPPVVVIDPAVVQNMGVQTALVTRGPLTKAVKTVGTLEAPEPGMHDISLKVGGWIEKLYANQEGQHIHKGDPLFDLYSSDLLVAGEELVGALKSAKSLGTAADDSLRASAESLVSSARRKLTLLDVPDSDIDVIASTLVVPRSFTFLSPSSGAVIEKMIVEGSSVQAGMKLMRIEDHSSLWLDLQVYEDQMELVAVGQAVDATVPAWPGRTFHGTITFIHPHVDHMSRTVVARAILENNDLVLRPGMYASATIQTTPVNDALQVHREAVIDTGSRQIVFVVKSSGHFEPRDVHMGITGNDGRVQILDGLAAGDSVVTSGQFLMDVESRTTEAVEKLRSAAMPAAMDTPPASQPAPAPTQMAIDMPPMPMASTAPAAKLTLAYCPMKKAPWLQKGEQLANPYFGTAMPDCGSVQRTLYVPAQPAELAPLIDAYLRVTSALAIDKLDPEAVAALRVAADRLADPADSAVKTAAVAVASAPDIDRARTALQALSKTLVSAIDAKPSAATQRAMGSMGDPK